MSLVKKYLLLSAILVSMLFYGAFVSAQNTDEIQKRVDDLKQKLVQIGDQKKTLSNQIQQMDTQISLAELQIQQSEKKIIETEHEIEKLGSRIDNLDSSLDKYSRILLQQIPRGYKTRTPSFIEVLLQSENISDLTNQIKYQQLTQTKNRKMLREVQNAKSSYEEQKVIREQKKQELDQLVLNLNNQKADLKVQQSQKERLLVETNNDESTYQTLLAQAQAQLKGFGQFVTSQGGAGLLSGQTSCDGWGCYYNQRDSTWGNILMNGRNDCDGPCNIARVGCLITSVSMIASHLGNRNITPADIAYNSSNFWPGTASLNKGTITAAGVNITRTTIASSLNPDLLQNGPVIVGIVYGPFGTHFVVVKSYTDGKYIMNDPYTEGGKDKNFTDYYSLGSVFEVDRVSL